MDKIVLHIGPLSDQGGMASVIDSITTMEIEGWDFLRKNSYDKSPFWSRITLVPNLIRELSNLNRKRRIDILHVHVTHGMSWFRKQFFFRWCVRNKLPIIIHIHSGRPDAIIKKSIKLLDKYESNNQIRIVVLENRWLDQFPCEYHNRVSVVNNAPRPQFTTNREYNNELVFGMFCRPLKHKKHDLAIEALNVLRNKGMNVKLIVTGRPYNDPPNWVEQHGWVSTENLQRIMEKCRFLIQTSQREGSSMTVIEAISMGLIPIVSEASRETVADFGIVVNGEDHMDWANAIENEIINAEDNRQQHKNKIRIYERSRIAKDWKSVYDSLT